MKITLRKKSTAELYELMDNPSVSNKKKLKIFSEIYHRYMISIDMYREHQKKIERMSHAESRTGWELTFEK